MPAHTSSTEMDISEDVSSPLERDIDRPCHQSPSPHAPSACEEHKETAPLSKVLSRAPSPTAIEEPTASKPSFATGNACHMVFQLFSVLLFFTRTTHPRIFRHAHISLPFVDMSVHHTLSTLGRVLVLHVLPCYFPYPRVSMHACVFWARAPR